MEKILRKSIFALLIICIAISCKKENVNKQNTSYKIKTVIIDNYISGNFDSILNSDTISVNIDSFLNVLRNETSSTSNILTFVNNDLVCRIAHDPGISEPSDFIITTLNNHINTYSYYNGYGSFGQYGSTTLQNNYTYQNNKLDSFYSQYFVNYFNDYSQKINKQLRFNYNNNLLVSIGGKDSLSYYNYISAFDTSYSKQNTCNFTYTHSYNNPRNQINLDVNDFVLNNVFFGYGIPQNFIILRLATYNTQSDLLIEHAHFDYFNPYGSYIPTISFINPLDVDVAYVFDDINRVQSFTIKVFLGTDLVDKTRYTIIYE